ncbi:hypothetical protein IT570_09465 [Candidatus Sumerlaeota bacterium]|nr:hypothetical protein [Candidatus Sumerlaeota bacterium]
MLKYLGFAAAAAILAAAPSVSFANVYATELSSVDGGANYALNFRLNENADNVAVEIVNSSSVVIKNINAGALLKGANSVNWDKTDNASVPAPSDTYTFRITASNTTGYAGWTQISSDASAQCQFFSSRGVAVNKNQASPLFGRVYVAENAGAVSGGRSTGTAGTDDGIFVLSSDLTDITGQGNSAYFKNPGWSTSASSPFNVALSDDGFIYISDWTDTNSDIWVGSESTLATPVTRLFGSETRSGAGVRNNGVADYHGSIQFMRLYGTGASKYMLTMDEDITVAGADPNSILRYDIGNVVSGYNTTPTVVLNDTSVGNLIQNGVNSFAFDNTGNIWEAQYRVTDGAAVPSLVRYNIGTSAIDFNSGTPTAPGPFNNSRRGRVDINPAGTLMAMAVSTNLQILDITTFPPTISATVVSAGATDCYGLVWDAAGNLYSTSPSSERLRVFSPPGANSFQTTSPVGASLVIGSSVSDWSLIDG